MIRVDVYVESLEKLQEQKWNVGSLVWLVPYSREDGYGLFVAGTCSSYVVVTRSFFGRNNDRLTSILAALFC